MHCAHCERVLRDELTNVDGVRAVEIDLEAKLVVVSGNALDDDALRSAIEEAGYEAA